MPKPVPSNTHIRHLGGLASVNCVLSPSAWYESLIVKLANKRQFNVIRHLSETARVGDNSCKFFNTKLRGISLITTILPISRGYCLILIKTSKSSLISVLLTICRQIYKPREKQLARVVFSQLEIRPAS